MNGNIQFNVEKAKQTASDIIRLAGELETAADNLVAELNSNIKKGMQTTWGDRLQDQLNENKDTEMVAAVKEFKRQADKLSSMADVAAKQLDQGI